MLPARSHHNLKLYYVIPRVEELVCPKLEVLPAADVIIEYAAELSEVIDVPVDVEANRPRHIALEVRREVLERGIDVASVEGRVALADDLDVLLRHRPRSIAPAIGHR